jgi:hypothetical protein
MDRMDPREPATPLDVATPPNRPPEYQPTVDNAQGFDPATPPATGTALAPVSEAKDADGLPKDPAARRKALRSAYYGVRPGTTRTAIPDVFADDVTPMKITYAVMTATQKQEFYDRFGTAKGVPVEKRAEAQRFIADRYLLKWEAYTTREGDLIPFEEDKAEDGTRKVSDKAWESAALPLRSDIYVIILTDNAPSPAEETGVKS